MDWKHAIYIIAIERHVVGFLLAIHHLTLPRQKTPCLPPQILPNHCFLLLLGTTVVPRKIEKNAFAKLGEGVNEEFYGQCENGEFWLLTTRSAGARSGTKNLTEISLRRRFPEISGD